jgi:oligopeptide/dipeptide ABC transporter ATP-binding protein
MIEAKNLTKTYMVRTKIFQKIPVYAVNNISLNIYKGETLGLVGESGCGKTTTGFLLLSLLRLTSGQILFNGNRIDNLSATQMKKYRSEMQIVFQDPYASMDPRLRVLNALAEPLVIYRRVGSKKEQKEKVAQLLESVGMRADDMLKYPYEFSGGQRQRICIARALALSPSFIVADEAVSALDVSIQAQILALLIDIKKKQDLTYLFISHDLAVIKYICDRIIVMYLGKIVESGKKADLFSNPLHPYTKALISSVPNIGKRVEYTELKGEVPSALNPPSGCVYHPRCPHAKDRCGTTPPLLQEVNGQQVACWLHE